MSGRVCDPERRRFRPPSRDRAEIAPTVGANRARAHTVAPVTSGHLVPTEEEPVGKGKVRAGYSQKAVLMLEPTRAANTVGSIVFGAVAAAVAVAAVLYREGRWPEAWTTERFHPSDQTLLIVAGVAAFILLLCIVGAIYNGSRWRTASRIKRLSNDARFAAVMPDTALPPMQPSAVPPPDLDVSFVPPRKVPKITRPLQRVSASANI